MDYAISEKENLIEIGVKLCNKTVIGKAMKTSRLITCGKYVSMSFLRGRKVDEVRLNEKLIETGEFIHESLLNGSSKTNPAFDEAVLLFVCNSLALLKEQEAIEPKRGFANTQKAWFCGACGFRLNWAGRYCSKCGKAVKWDGFDRKALV